MAVAVYYQLHVLNFERLFRMLDGLNFKEYVAFLSAFSSRASLQQKVEFIFKVYDSDGNGKVTFNEMLDILCDLTGQFISEQQREKVLTQVLEEAGYRKDSLLVQADFMKVMVEIPKCARVGTFDTINTEHLFYLFPIEDV